MNENQPIDQTSSPEASVINERITAAIHARHRKIHFFMGVAIGTGFLALMAGVFIFLFYLHKYEPAHREMMDTAKQLEVENAHSEQTTLPDGYKRVLALQRTHIFMTHVVSVGVIVTAGCLAVLGMGTLVLLTVIMLNRRATLSQINVSLAQISSQLKEMQLRENKLS
jgi:hypothetical protein